MNRREHSRMSLIMIMTRWLVHAFMWLRCTTFQRCVCSFVYWGKKRAFSRIPAKEKLKDQEGAANCVVSERETWWTTKCRKGMLSDFLRAQTKTLFLTQIELLIVEGNHRRLKKTTQYTNKHIYGVETHSVKVVTDDDETTGSICWQIFWGFLWSFSSMFQFLHNSWTD